MAEKVIIEFELSTEQAQKSLENYIKAIQKVNESFADTSKKGVDSMNAVDKEVKETTGLINKLREQESLLKKSRDSANDVNSLRKFNNELRKTQTELQRLESVGKSAFSKILEDARATFTGIAAFNVAQAGLQGIKDIFSTGFNAAVNQEQFLISAEVMLGSAEAAKILNQELTDLAARTPFESSDLQQATKVLLGFGVEADKLLPTLKTLGDVSGGNSEKLNSLALAFGQVKAAGRLMGQEVLQMINAGFNPLQEISRNTGKSMATLKAEMERGLIGFDQVEKAFVTVTSEGGKFFNMMERQSTTTGGKLSTLKDNFVILLRDGVNLLLPAINSFIDFLSATITYIYAFGVAIASIPKFVKENKDVFMLLGSAIVLFNLHLIRSTSLLLLNLAAQKLAIIEGKAFATVTNLQSAALTRLMAIAMANPYGLLVGGVAALVAGIVYLNKETEKGNKLRNEATESLGKELTNLESLVIVATSDVRTREERIQAINELNAVYGQYLSFLIDEYTSLDLIRRAQEEVTRAMVNNTLYKMKAKEQEENLTNQVKQRLTLLNMIEEKDNGLSSTQRENLGNLLREYETLNIQLKTFSETYARLNELKEEEKEQTKTLASLQGTLKGLDPNLPANLAQINKFRKDEANTLELIAKTQNEIRQIEERAAKRAKEDGNVFDTETNIKRRLEVIRRNAGDIGSTVTGLAEGISDLFGDTSIRANIVKYFDNIDKGVSTIDRYRVAIIGTNGEVKKNTNIVNANAGGSGSAHGKAAKQYEYNLKLIEANTKAIEANITKMQEQTDLIKLQEIQRKSKATQLKIEIDNQALQTSVLKRESTERQNIALNELQKDRDRELEKLNDAKKKAELRLKNEFITTDERNRIITFITTEYQSNLLQLTNNFESEKNKITDAYQNDNLKIVEFSYQKQVQYLNTFIDQQKEALKKGVIELNDINKQFQVAKIADIGSSQAQGASQLIEKDRQVENENLVQKELLEARKKNEDELSEAKRKRIYAGTIQEIAAIELEIDAYKAKLKVIENDLDKSAQRRYDIEYSYLQKVNELNLRILNEQIEKREKAEQDIQDRLSSIRDNVAKQGGLGGEIGQNIINLGNDFIKLQVKFEETAMALRLKARKEGLQKLYDAEVAANGKQSELAKKLKAEIEDNEKETIEAQKQFQIQRFNSTVDFILNSVLAVTSALGQIIDVQIAQQDRLIKAQEQRVEEAEKLAEKGNAVQLKLEKQRLDDLNKEREKFVRKQQALAVIELLANSAAAIAKSANMPPPFNIIAIAATVAALGAGLVAAKQKAQAAASGFKTGGYTGDGSTSQEAGVVHKKEFVFTAEKTAKYKPIFQAIHENRLDLNKALLMPKMKESVLMMRGGETTNLDTSNLEKRMENIESAILSLPNKMPQTNVSINEHGIYAITERQKKLNNRLKG